MRRRRNAFVAKREQLDQAEGRHFSDWDIAQLLGIQPRHVYTLSRARDCEIRPSYLLALEAAIEWDYRACDDLEEPTKEEFARLVDEISMTKEEIALYLGLTGGALYQLRVSPTVTISRSHFLAVKLLHHYYGPKPNLQAHRAHALAYRKH